MSRFEEHAEGAGPFTTRVTWRPAGGGTAVWESRRVRKRGVLDVRAPGEARPRERRADVVSRGRLRRLNAVAALAFTVGGALFALGAALSEHTPVGSASRPVSVSVYFVGGLFFNTGGYASLLQAINTPRRDRSSGVLAGRRWRWWSYEPHRIDWLSTFTLFAGTLVFGVNLLDSFLTGLSAVQTNRLVWAPDMVGCFLFLISGHLALVEVCHGRPGIRARDLGWWIVAVNQLGSVLFLVSALAAFTRPATGSPVNIDIANWGTFSGALCFCAGGILQFFERPGA
ncbi:hypothetical protein [Streptomyces tropicalis]|uniref:NADH-ubiquinone oxidoreductase n=1 Tax=Streptomyces tropicalis TaxID=3034234 RepID=A0ABT6A6M8_9ACTN|nr:hypothetical protein [Streptomyces tropicalis]MDF3300294.1 hypothetical protein [Streptomyces tropicalis]